MFLNSLVYASRLKDIAHIKGVRKNQLIGYGLVIGLNGTGDGKSQFTKESMSKFLGTLGVKVKPEAVDPTNVAAVVVTANLPPFSKVGQKVDVKVSAIGSVTSLVGGTLIMTPLKGADNQIYVVAQGSVSMGGGEGKKFHPTVGEIANGGVVEKSYTPDFLTKRTIDFVLNNNDFTTTARVARAIDEYLGGKYASTTDSNTVSVTIPYNYTGSIVQLLASLENINIQTDSRAKIVLNERTGTIVMGANVIISPVAISHGDLTIKVKGKNTGLLADVESKEAAGSINKPGDKIIMLEEGANVADVVKGLNAIGASSSDLIPILQAIKAVGAIHADLELL